MAKKLALTTDGLLERYDKNDAAFPFALADWNEPSGVTNSLSSGRLNIHTNASIGDRLVTTKGAARTEESVQALIRVFTTGGATGGCGGVEDATPASFDANVVHYVPHGFSGTESLYDYDAGSSNTIDSAAGVNLVRTAYHWHMAWSDGVSAASRNNTDARVLSGACGTGGKTGAGGVFVSSGSANDFLVEVFYRMKGRYCTVTGLTSGWKIRIRTADGTLITEKTASGSSVQFDMIQNEAGVHDGRSLEVVDSTGTTIYAVVEYDATGADSRGFYGGDVYTLTNVAAVTTGIVNPGAETGDETGWNSGGGTVPQASNLFAYTGTYSWRLHSSITGTGYLYQDRWDTAWQAAVDDGTAELFVRYRQRGVAGQNDGGRIGVEFFDGAMSSLGTSPALNRYLQGVAGAFIPRGFSIAVPTTTRTLRFYIYSNQNSGVDPDGYIDDIEADISIGGPGQPTLTLTADDFYADAQGSSYAHSEGLAHAATQWQLATDAGYTAIVQDFTDTYPSGAPDPPVRTFIDLLASTTYYARVRYQDSGGTWSAWGEDSATTGAGTAPTTPTISTATPSYDQVTLVGSAFADPEDPDRSHISTDWQVDTSGGDYSTPVAQSLDDLSNLTSITLGGLTASTSYIARVRYRAEDGAWSAWSTNKSFSTTADPASKPSTPTASLQSKTSASITVQGTAFAYPGEPFTHAETLVQVSTSSTFAGSGWSSGFSVGFTGKTVALSFTPGQVTDLLVDDLSAGTLYYYRIRYRASDGIWSDWSATQSTTTDATALGSTFLVITAPRHGAVVRGASYQVTWTPASADGITFDLEYTSDYLTWNSIATGVSASPYSWDTTTLTDGTYTIRIRATDGISPTAWEYRVVVVDNASDPYIFNANIDDGQPSADFAAIWNTAGHTWTLNESSVIDVGSHLASQGWAALAYGPPVEPNQVEIICEALNASTGGSFPWSWFPEQCWTGVGVFASGSGSDATDGILAAFYSLPINPIGDCFTGGRGDGFLNVEAYKAGTRVLSESIPLGKIHFAKLFGGCSKVPRYGVRLRVSTIADLGGGTRRLRVQAAVHGMEIDSASVGEWHYEGVLETDLSCGQPCYVGREITTSQAYRSFTNITVVPISYGACPAPAGFTEPEALESCSPPQFDLTIFGDDDQTPIWGSGTADGEITEASFSTDPFHPRPWLVLWDNGPSHEVDPIEGSSSIGQIAARVLDKRSDDCDPRSGSITAGIADTDGFNALIGRRSIWREKLSDGTWIRIHDGPLYDVRLADSMAAYHFTARSPRERERKTPLFDTQHRTASVFPYGPVNGYGFLGTVFSGLSLYLVNPAPIARGQYTRRGTYGSNGVIAGTVTNDGPETYLITPQAEDQVKIVSPAIKYDDTNSAVYRYFPDVILRWRPAGGDDSSWVYLEDMPAAGHGSVSPGGYSGATEPMLDLYKIPDQLVIEQGLLYTVIGVQLNAFDTADLPTDGQQIEWQVLANNEPSESFPFYYEGNAGTFLKNAYDGLYSPTDPHIVYDSAGMQAFVDRAPNIRLRKTETEDDMRDWLEGNIYSPFSEVPGLSEDGKLIPVSTKLPDGSASLTTLDNALVMPGATWSQDGGDAVPIARFRYVREYRDVVTQDPLRYGLVEQVVWFEKYARSATFLQGKGVSFEPETVRSVGGTLGLSLTGGDPLNEFAGRLALDKVTEVTDRYAFGPERISLRARPTAAVRALRVGTWCIVDLDWIPNLGTRYRGGPLLCLVIRRQLDVGLAYSLDLLVGGVGQAGLTPWTLSAPTVNGDLSVTLTIDGEWFGWSSGFSSGFGDPDVTIRVQYAVADTEPSATSGDWTLLALLNAAGDVTTEPIPAGSTVWFRARAERVGYRPSAWSASVSASVGATTPVLYTLSVTIAPDGTPTILWSENPPTLGLYVEYGVQGAGSFPLYGSVVELDAKSPSVSGWSSGFSTGFTGISGVQRIHVLSGVTVDDGEEISVRVTPYTGWTGTNVSGSAGDPRTAQATQSGALVGSGFSDGFSTGFGS